MAPGLEAWRGAGTKVHAVGKVAAAGVLAAAGSRSAAAEPATLTVGRPGLRVIKKQLPGEGLVLHLVERDLLDRVSIGSAGGRGRVRSGGSSPSCASRPWAPPPGACQAVALAPPSCRKSRICDYSLGLIQAAAEILCICAVVVLWKQPRLLE